MPENIFDWHSKSSKYHIILTYLFGIQVDLSIPIHIAMNHIFPSLCRSRRVRSSSDTYFHSSDQMYRLGKLLNWLRYNISDIGLLVRHKYLQYLRFNSIIFILVMSWISYQH